MLFEEAVPFAAAAMVAFRRAVLVRGCAMVVVVMLSITRRRVRIECLVVGDIAAAFNLVAVKEDCWVTVTVRIEDKMGTVLME